MVVAKRSSTRCCVYAFSEAAQRNTGTLGGKGNSLASMVQLGLNVPPGFVVTTSVSRAIMENLKDNSNAAVSSAAPNRLWKQVERELLKLEQSTGKGFGSDQNPLLVSVRSGAKDSMPGMMDTVLNVGITSTNLSALKAMFGRKIATELFSKFRKSFRDLVGVLPPDDVRLQLRLAMEAVWKSWNSERAVAYRKSHRIPNNGGTAVIVQAMVFGLGKKSGTGVVFSKNVSTGDSTVYGEYLRNAQGEDVVSGIRTPEGLDTLRAQCPEAHEELLRNVQMLADHYGDVVDIEFTVQNSELFILQTRRAKRTAHANARFLVQSVWEKKKSKEEILATLSKENLQFSKKRSFDPASLLEANRQGVYLSTGLPASVGAATGVAVFSKERAMQLASEGKSVVLIREDTDPKDLPGMLKSSAIITCTGGVTSHAAVVARSLNIPAVVGLGTLDHAKVEGNSLVTDEGVIREGDLISVDGATGSIYRGEITLVGATTHKEISILLKWVKELRPEIFRCQILPDFDLLKEKFDCSQLLVDFYFYSAISEFSRGSKFENETKDLFDRKTKEISEIFLTYLVIAVGGEVRHMPRSHSDNDPYANSYNLLVKDFGVAKGDRQNTQHRVVDSFSDLSLDRVIRFFELSEHCFFDPNWRLSYGGPKWAAIAHAPLMLLKGEITSEMFVDHVFDLRHNGGVLFNKHQICNSTREHKMSDFLERKKRAQSLVDLCIKFKYEEQYQAFVRENRELIVKLGLEATFQML